MWRFCVLTVMLLGSARALDSDKVVDLEKLPLELSPEFMKEMEVLAESSNLFDAGISAKVNDYCDRIVTNIQIFLIKLGYDPMELPAQHQGFSKRIFFITYHGEFDLTKGWLQDTATIKRAGDAYISYQPSTKKLRIEIPIGFDDLMFNYKYSIKFMNLGPVGGLDGKISNVRINSAIEIDFSTFKASLEKFTVVNSGHVDIEFTGHILTDWLLNMMSEMTTTLLHNVILGIVSGIARGGLQVAVDDINQILYEILNPTTPAPTTLAPTTPTSLNATTAHSGLNKSFF